MSKTNYQLLSDKIIAEVSATNSRPTMLLHVCCAPCASYVLEYLSPYFDLTVLFYNPNIYPAEEYERRLGEVRRLIGLMDCGISLIEDEYTPADYIARAAGLEGEPEGGLRCVECIGMRIERTATLAAGKFDYFATTLSISPHKNAELINTLGYAAAEKYGAVWFPADFKKRGGYARSCELCREYDIYRQNYCGCSFAKNAMQV